MTARREQRTAKRLRAANRGRWRKAGKPHALASRNTVIVSATHQLECARRYREFVRLALNGEIERHGFLILTDGALKHSGFSVSRHQTINEAVRHAKLALSQWRWLEERAKNGCRDSRDALLAIAADAGITDPLEVSGNEQV